MFKSLQDLFKIPPPTTYEIEAGEEAKRTGVMTAAAAPYFAWEERMNPNRKRKDRSTDDETDQANDAKRQDTKAVSFVPTPKDKSYIPLSPDYGRTYDSPDYGKTDYGISSYLPDYVPTYDSPDYGRTGDLSNYDSPVYGKTYGTPDYGKTNDSPAYVRTPSPIAQILPPIVKAEPIGHDLSKISNKQEQAKESLNYDINTEVNTYSPDNEMGTKAKDSKTITPTQELNKVTQQPTKANNTYVSPLDIILQSVKEEKNKNTPKPVSLHPSSTTPPPTNNSPTKANNTYVSPLDIILQSVQEEKNKNAPKPVSLHPSSTTPPPTNSSPTKANSTYVSPLDIIIQSVQEEKSKNLPMPVSLPSDSASQLTTPPPTTNNLPPNNAPTSSTEQLLQFAKSVVHGDDKTKKKPGRRMRLKKQKQKQLEEKERIKKYHLDRPYNRTDLVDKKESDLFNEFEQLKAKKEREASRQAQTSSSPLGPHKTSSTSLENHTITPVSYEALPDYHIPPSLNTNHKKQGQQQQKNKRHVTPFVPRKPCFKYQNGCCTAGDKCTFRHDVPVNPPAPPPKKSTVVCQYFKVGACTQFEDCTFSHDLKLEPCRFFHMSGRCEQGEQCQYSHGVLDDDKLKRLRALTGPCRFYHLKGYCNQPDTCKFSHEEFTDEELKPVEANIRPCRFFHLFNNCKKGDECFYLHETATAEQVKELLAAEKKK